MMTIGSSNKLFLLTSQSRVPSRARWYSIRDQKVKEAWRNKKRAEAKGKPPSTPAGQLPIGVRPLLIDTATGIVKDIFAERTFTQSGREPFPLYDAPRDRLMIADGRSVRFWDGSRLKQIHEDPTLAASSPFCAVSTGTSPLLATSSAEGHNIELWNADTLQPVGTLPGHELQMMC